MKLGLKVKLIQTAEHLTIKEKTIVTGFCITNVDNIHHQYLLFAFDKPRVECGYLGGIGFRPPYIGYGNLILEYT